MKRLLFAATMLLALLGATAPARAGWTNVPLNTPLVTMNFQGVTFNNATNTQIGINQLSVTLEAISQSQVRFRFNNVGANEAVISEIYFQDLERRINAFTGFDSIIQNTSVAFKVGGSPQRLPGGENLDPDFVTNFMVSADGGGNKGNSGTKLAGIDRGEQLGVTFSLKNTYNGQPIPTNELVRTLMGDIEGGLFKIGMHVISIRGGDSESFVTDKITYHVPIPTPEPGALALLGLGVLAVGLRRRRG